MTRKEISDRVRTIVANELCIHPDQVTLEAQLRGDELKADSLDLVNLVMAFAIEFGVEMRDEQVQKIVSVGDIVNYLNAYRF